MDQKYDATYFHMRVKPVSEIGKYFWQYCSGVALYMTSLCTSYSCSNFSPAPLEGAKALCLSQSLLQIWKNRDHNLYLNYRMRFHLKVFHQQILLACQWIISTSNITILTKLFGSNQCKGLYFFSQLISLFSFYAYFGLVCTHMLLERCLLVHSGSFESHRRYLAPLC